MSAFSASSHDFLPAYTSVNLNSGSKAIPQTWPIARLHIVILPYAEHIAPPLYAHKSVLQPPWHINSVFTSLTWVPRNPINNYCPTPQNALAAVVTIFIEMCMKLKVLLFSER